MKVMSEQFNVLLCSHTSVMELWLLTIQCLSHLGNKGYTEVCILNCTFLVHHGLHCSHVALEYSKVTVLVLYVQQ